jgi:hypothetical protein
MAALITIAYQGFEPRFSDPLNLKGPVAVIDSNGLMWGWTGTAAAGSSATSAETAGSDPHGYHVLSSERHDQRHFGCAALSKPRSAPRQATPLIPGSSGRWDPAAARNSA